MLESIGRILLLFVSSSILGTVSLLAQAPTDEWRRGGLDAMVAESGGAASLLSNPAGIKTQEERHKLNQDKKKPGTKYEWITELLAADMFLTADTWSLLGNPATTLSRIRTQFGYLTGLSKLMGGQPVGSEETVALLRGLPSSEYAALVAGTGLPGNSAALTIALLEALTPLQGARLADNFKNNNSLITGISTSVVKQFVRSLGDLGLEHFSRIFSLSHVNDKKPLAWGFYFGVEQKLSLRNKVQSVSLLLNFAINDIDLKADIPIGLQAYVVTPLRIALAHDFNEVVPGFTFGLGLKVVPYLGINQTSLGRLISNSVDSTGVNIDAKLLTDAIFSLGGMNIGLDLGLQYHFGAIIPQLEFLHMGLKISDLLGFNVPFSDKGDTLRYALDFDWGIYAEYQFPSLLQVFGGFEIIQLRGLFTGGQSPYSALYEPLDHLRFLVGLGLFNNVLRITLQYYNSNFSPGIMLNLGSFQLHAAFNSNSAAEGSLGMEFTIRFRGPHNGFNKKTPYRTYASMRRDREGKANKLDKEKGREATTEMRIEAAEGLGVEEAVEETETGSAERKNEELDNSKEMGIEAAEDLGVEETEGSKVVGEAEAGSADQKDEELDSSKTPVEDN